jgi:hypothetical protein
VLAQQQLPASTLRLSLRCCHNYSKWLCQLLAVVVGLVTAALLPGGGGGAAGYAAAAATAVLMGALEALIMLIVYLNVSCLS